MKEHKKIGVKWCAIKCTSVAVIGALSATPAYIYAEQMVKHGITKDQMLSSNMDHKQPCGCKPYHLPDRCTEGYFVIYPEAVPRLYAISYYMSCKGKEPLPSMFEYCAQGAAVEDIRNFDNSGKNLPNTKFVIPLVLFSELDPAQAFQKMLPSSDIITNTDGYYSANFLVRVQQSISYSDLNYLNSLKKLAPESEGIDFQDDSALIVFGACLTKKNALNLTSEIQKKGVRARMVRVKVNEPDL